MELLALETPWALAGLIILAFLIAVTAEAVVMQLFKLNPFKKCLGDSFMANVGSLLLGILLFLIFNKAEFEGITEFSELVILYFLTVLFESWIVRLLNSHITWGKILLPAVIMNLLTFAVMYVYLKFDMGF